MKMKNVLYLLLFLLGGFLAGSLVVSCAHKGKKEVPPAAAQPPKKEAPPTGTKPEPVKSLPSLSVDFDNALLSEVALFVTSKTGKSIILNGKQQVPISWNEYNIPSIFLLPAFSRALLSAGLVLKPTDSNENSYTVEKAEEEQVPYKLNFATCSKGVFFLFGKDVISKDKFQHPLRHIGGQWFAMIPKSLADHLTATEGNQNGKI